MSQTWGGFERGGGKGGGRGLGGKKKKRKKKKEEKGKGRHKSVDLKRGRKKNWGSRGSNLVSSPSLRRRGRGKGVEWKK